ncbi:hypothetical protein ACFE04_009626 [Oxalis oulophora]
MGLIKSAIGDAVLTSMWVFSMPFLGIITTTIAKYFNVQTLPIALVLISTITITIMIIIFGLVGNILGGASFNPSTTVAFYAAGLSPTTSLMSMAVRFPASAAGAVAGAKAIGQVMPEKFKFMLKGPSLKVDLHTGFLVEGALTFLLSFNLLLIMLKGPKNMLVKIYLLSVSTIGLVFVGSKFTGPSMNPANAFGWAYVKDWHNEWELYYVYLAAPLIGATLAAKVFGLVFPPPQAAKEKAA